MTKARFLESVQHRTARVAITASATRGQGTKGVVGSARRFLAGLNLERFGTSDQRKFRRQLDAATAQLSACLPPRGASWGLSRKLINIFLRDSFYTTYLARANRLAAAERLLEIPLDSITAKRLRNDVPELPRWLGVKRLDQDVSAAYQTAALLVAKRQGVARVHLDASWWGTRY